MQNSYPFQGTTQVCLQASHENTFFNHQGIAVPYDDLVPSPNRSPDGAQERHFAECLSENSSNYLDLLSQRSSGCSEETDSQECDKTTSSTSNPNHCCSRKNSLENYDTSHAEYGAYKKNVHNSHGGAECSFNHLESYSERKSEEAKLDRVNNWKDRNKPTHVNVPLHSSPDHLKKYDPGNSGENTDDSPVTLRKRQKPIPKKRYSLDKESVEGIYDNAQMSSLSEHERTNKSKGQSDINNETLPVDDSQSSGSNSLIFEHLEKLVHQSLLEIEQIDTSALIQENCSDNSKKNDDQNQFLEEENSKRKDEASEAANSEEHRHSHCDEFKRRSDSFGKAIENGDIFPVSGVKSIPLKPERKTRPKTKSKSDVSTMIPSNLNQKNQPPPLPGRGSSRILGNLKNLPGQDILSDKNMSVLSGYSQDLTNQQVEQACNANSAVVRTQSAGAVDSQGRPRRPPPDRKPPPLPDNISCDKHIGSQTRRPLKGPPPPPHEAKSRNVRVKRQNDKPSKTVSSDSEGDYSEISEITPAICESYEDKEVPQGESIAGPPCLPPRNIVSADSTTPQAPPRRKSRGKISSTMLNDDLSTPIDVLKSQEYSHLHARPDSIVSSQSESSHGSQDHDQSLSDPETEDEKAAVSITLS